MVINELQQVKQQLELEKQKKQGQQQHGQQPPQPQQPQQQPPPQIQAHKHHSLDINHRNRITQGMLDY